MRRVLDYLANVEPAIAFMAIRTLLYLAVGVTGSWLSPDTAEQVLGALALLLGVDVATTAGTRTRVTSPKTVGELVAATFVGPVGEFIKNTVKALVPATRLVQGLNLVTPLLAQYADRQLDDDTRALIQRQVHLRLRNAGLIRKRDVNINSSLVLVIPFLVLVLGACAPVAQFFGGTIDVVAGDDAQLTVVSTGIQFDPGEQPALRVGVDILGATLITSDPRCTLETLDDLQALDCRLGDVTQPTIISLSGTEVTATAQYQRPDRSRFFLTTLD